MKKSSLVGKKVGNYVIKALIGRGGMGSVYSAEHPRIGRKVAIKVLADHLAVQENMARRFETEARAMARLLHPNIIEIYDFGNLDNGTPYYVMELLLGCELRQVMKECKQMTAREVLPYLEQICAALQAAHDRSVVHRDLKPENIFVLEGEPMRLKILDFGIAKILETEQGAAITTSGMILGSPVFASPEQVAGESAAISPRTDLYSLGVMLYSQLCGRPPFTSKSSGVLIAMHLKDQPPPLLVKNPSVPAPVAELIHQCLEKKPSLRPESATALLEAYRVALEPSRRRVVVPSQQGDPTGIGTEDTCAGAGTTGKVGLTAEELTVRDLSFALPAKDSLPDTNTARRASSGLSVQTVDDHIPPACKETQRGEESGDDELPAGCVPAALRGTLQRAPKEIPPPPVGRVPDAFKETQRGDDAGGDDAGAASPPADEVLAAFKETVRGRDDHVTTEFTDPQETGPGLDDRQTVELEAGGDPDPAALAAPELHTTIPEHLLEQTVLDELPTGQVTLLPDSYMAQSDGLPEPAYLPGIEAAVPTEVVIPEPSSPSSKGTLIALVIAVLIVGVAATAGLLYRNSGAAKAPAEAVDVDREEDEPEEARSGAGQGSEATAETPARSDAAVPRAPDAARTPDSSPVRTTTPRPVGKGTVKRPKVIKNTVKKPGCRARGCRCTGQGCSCDASGCSCSGKRCRCVGEACKAKKKRVGDGIMDF